MEAEIDRQLAICGEAVDLKVACPFHPDFTPGYGSTQAYWRKPGPGMVAFACIKLEIDPRKSWLIGDKASDVQSAKAADLSGAYFLRGFSRAEEAAALALVDERFWVRTADAGASIALIE